MTKVPRPWRVTTMPSASRAETALITVFLDSPNSWIETCSGPPYFVATPPAERFRNSG